MKTNRTRSRSWIWAGVLCVPMVSSPTAVQARRQSQDVSVAPGPIARAAAREAGGLMASLARQPGDAMWARLRELKPARAILVDVRGSLPRKVFFVRADDSALTISASRQGVEERIARGDVLQISLPEPHPGRIGALIGAGIGAGAAAASVAGCNSGESVCAVKGAWAALWGGIGAAAGAGIGAMVGSFHDRTQDVIYRAP